MGPPKGSGGRQRLRVSPDVLGGGVPLFTQTCVFSQQRESPAGQDLCSWEDRILTVGFLPLGWVAFRVLDQGLPPRGRQVFSVCPTPPAPQGHLVPRSPSLPSLLLLLLLPQRSTLSPRLCGGLRSSSGAQSCTAHASPGRLLPVLFFVFEPQAVPLQCPMRFSGALPRL